MLDYPHEGAVLRCELDGSKLEVVHHGLRNPQELAFDQWGDLFTGDNNSDGGDKARIVQITPGADSGWRIGFQWLNDRGAWNREKMWHARHPEQTAAILPPIRNFADGPSGLVYDTGIGLPERFRDNFFLCDFRGGGRCLYTKFQQGLCFGCRPVPGPDLEPGAGQILRHGRAHDTCADKTDNAAIFHVTRFL